MKINPQDIQLRESGTLNLILKNKQLGTRRDDLELLDLFEPREGSINLYYGRIGNGKTYNATADILDYLAEGRVVYANWRINYQGFDERYSFGVLIAKTIGFRSTFYNFPAQNLHYISWDEEQSPKEICYCGKFHSLNVDTLEALNDCDIFLDEGQWFIDSYEKTDYSKKKRKFILHTRHLCRSLSIITQRPTAIQVSARGNVNIFFKCEKILTWPFIVFKRTEFQDMVGETVDEMSDPISVKRYIASAKVFDAYNSKYLRQDLQRSQRIFFEAYDLSLRDKVFGLKSKIQSMFRLKPEHAFARFFGKSLGVEAVGTTIKKPDEAQHGSGSGVDQQDIPF